MASSGIFENKGMLKETLMGELKAYRNISVKAALISWSLSLAAHYTYSIIGKEAINIQIQEAMYQSLVFSLTIGLIAYCIGSVLGAHLQRKRLTDIKRKRDERKRYIEEQIAIRQAKLQVI